MPFPPFVSRHRALLLLAVALAVNVGLSIVGWRHSPREIHDSRQVQTALSIHWMAREGLSLAYPLPLFGPPWSAPFEFPLYQGTAALIARATGIRPEPAGRVASLLYLYLALPAAWMVQRFIGVAPERRWIFPALLLLSPAHLYYSRSFMIESAAMCAGLWFLWAFGHALTRRNLVWALGAAALGALVAAAKLTTAVVFLVPAAAFTLRCLLRPGAEPAPTRGLLGTALTAALLAGITLGTGMLWTRYADGIKASNPLATAFVSSGLGSFVFGTLEQRFQAGFWIQVAKHAASAVMPAANAVLLLVFGLLLARRSRLTIGALLVAFLSGPLVFANLHAVHDYYFYACGVFALLALAVALAELSENDQHPRAARAAIVGLALAIQLVGYLVHYFPAQRWPSAKEPGLAPVMRAVTRHDDVLLVLGHDWNPALAYFSQRKAIMVVDRWMSEPERIAAMVGEAGPSRVTALVVGGHYRLYPNMYRDLLARLNMDSQPVLVAPDAHVYFASPLADEVREFVHLNPIEGFALAAEAADEVTMSRNRIATTDLPDPRIVSTMKPAPVEVLHPFSPSVHVHQDRLVTDAHAPTDFIFSVPAGATKVEVEFGILPGAYASDQPTDGVDFKIEFFPADGRRRTLFSRELRPRGTPSDRGTQRATVEIPPGGSGRLVCRTLPGPGGSIASDWAYWARIEIK